MKKEVRLMKGNEALAEAAIRHGVDGYFGYPITPQSEVLEYLAAEDPYHKRTGMVVLQAESEIAAINMVYGGAGTGKKVMTSSSSPGVSLKQEGISYIAGAELPALIVNVMRAGPGLGAIQPGQADYFQAVKGGGHGDYRVITLAPSSVQEMYDFVAKSYDLAFKYRTPVMILSDGAIGQMMEKVELSPQLERMPDDEIKKNYPWATVGRKKGEERTFITSLDLDAYKFEKHNHVLQAKYRKIEENEVIIETINADDAEYLIVAFGTSARVSFKAMDLLREKGHKVGLVRPITLWPFPKNEIKELANNVKGMLTVEMNAGQMIEDVKLAVEGKVPVEFYGRMGGVIPSPEEVVQAMEEKIIKG